MKIDNGVFLYMHRVPSIIIAFYLMSRTAYASTIPIVKGDCWVYQHERIVRHHGKKPIAGDTINECKLYCSVDSVRSSHDTVFFTMSFEISGILRTFGGSTKTDNRELFYRNRSFTTYASVDGAIHAVIDSMTRYTYDSLVTFTPKPDSSFHQVFPFPVQLQRRTLFRRLLIFKDSTEVSATTTYAHTRKPGRHSSTLCDTSVWAEGIGMLHTAVSCSLAREEDADSTRWYEYYTCISFNNNPVDFAAVLKKIFIKKQKPAPDPSPPKR